MGKKKVLVIDDETDFLKVMKLRLEANNYKVITAEDGIKGLDAIKNDKPDVVLLDILMPGLDGLSVLKKIKESNKSLPVFMITAYSNEERFATARELGASGFIVKTSNLQQEIDNVTAALRFSDKYRPTG